MPKRHSRKENEMTKIVANPRGGQIEIRIDNGLIVGASSKGKTTESQTITREEKDKIQWWLIMIFKDEFKAFEKIIHLIREDEVFCPYVKGLMDAEQTNWIQRKQRYQEEVDEKMKDLQEKIDQYTWAE